MLVGGVGVIVDVGSGVVVKTTQIGVGVWVGNSGVSTPQLNNITATNNDNPILNSDGNGASRCN